MYYHKYLETINNCISSAPLNSLKKIENKIIKLKKNSKLVFVGNGGSASIASHVSVDFTKVAKIPSINFNEANLITCFANDFGHDKWMSKAIEHYSQKDDLIFLISSSGNSQNIINAAKYCKKNKIYLITLTGFYGKNKLSKLGDINLIVNSNNYNHIEMTHNTWLLSIMDKIIDAKF